jgi:hypothetical protein
VGADSDYEQLSAGKASGDMERDTFIAFPRNFSLFVKLVKKSSRRFIKFYDWPSKTIRLKKYDKDIGLNASGHCRRICLNSRIRRIVL